MRRWTVSVVATLGAVLGLCATGLGFGVAAAAGAASPVLASAVSVVGVNELNGVSCLSAKDCVAVGERLVANVGSFPLAEQWNGKNWRVLPVKLPAGSKDEANLSAVSCRPGGCVAVGGYAPIHDLYAGPGAVPAVLVESWNGTRWSLDKVSLPSGTVNAGLWAVSCLTARDCLATGGYLLKDGRSAPLAEKWNGKTWTLSRPPLPAHATSGGLYGVSCTSATSCMAVGAADGNAVLTEAWNGKSWKLVNTPSPSKNTPSLSSVSCLSASRCVAVGGFPSAGQAGYPASGFAETWNGSKWTEAKVPGATSRSGLDGVGCGSAARCLAVGFAFSTATFGYERATAVTLVGSRWALTKAPARPADYNSEFAAVTCLSPTECVAVGSESIATWAAPSGLSAFWNGKSWKVINAAR